MGWSARLFRSRLLLRGAMIVALFVALQTLLLQQRAELIEQEAAYGYAILDNAWSISELLNETKNLSAKLTGYAVGRASQAEVQLSFDLLWSRIGALRFAERIEFEGLVPLMDHYEKFLDRHEDHVFGAVPMSQEIAMMMVPELDELSGETRRLWSVQFNQNRSQFLGQVSGEISGAARQLDGMIGLVGLAGLAYLAFELLLSNRALAREQALVVEAQSANATKTAFLANMSHEVRTPLNGVIGSTDLLKETSLTSEQRLLVDTIGTSAEHLLGVVNQVLDISKIEAGKMEIENGIVDLPETAAIVLAMFEKDAADKGIELRRVEAKDVPRHIRGDPLRLRQVLANLVSNAVKFTPQGEIVMSMDLVPDGAGDQRLSLRVTDTGIGIPLDAQSRVFEAFAQNEISDTRCYGGTGLGLTISRQLIRLMGGELSLSSTPGAGTEVRVDLPLVPVAVSAEPAASPTESRVDEVMDLTVLVADDNATNRLLLVRMLKRLVTGIAEAEDGSAVVERWRRGGIDLILMDVQMPVMSGVEAAAMIRACELEDRRDPVPIYSLSANAMPHQISSYADAGMNGHLSKPFRKSEIVEVLRRHAETAPPAQPMPVRAAVGQVGLRSAQPAKTFSSATTT